MFGIKKTKHQNSQNQNPGSQEIDNKQEQSQNLSKNQAEVNGIISEGPIKKEGVELKIEKPEKSIPAPNADKTETTKTKTLESQIKGPADQKDKQIKSAENEMIGNTQKISDDEQKKIAVKNQLRKVIGINIGSVVGSISFSKQNFGGTLTMEQITRFAKKYEEILAEVDRERHEISRILAENYKKLTEIIDNKEENKESNKNKQANLIPQIIDSINKLLKKSEEYNKLDPDDPLHNATKPKLEESRNNLEKYLEQLKN